jgi:hypothetical protein
MNRISMAFIVGAVVLAMGAPAAVPQERRGDVLISNSRDCGQGTVEQRLDCLTFEVAQLKQRLEGREGRVTPLQR